MADNEEVVMTPLLAPEGVTVLKVERVSRGLLDPRTVHYVAGGRYKGIIINRAAKERPEHRSPTVRKNFTCYIGTKLKGEPQREQRQLRFWFRQGSLDVDPMADRFFKELINPHLFPRDYIGYVKRILQLLQGYPTVAKMELEMRPARPDEEDQQYVVRRMTRQRSQPPPGIVQEDFHTWHSHSRGGSRGELGAPVGAERVGVIVVEGKPRPHAQEDNRSIAERRGNVISEWQSPALERRLVTSSPSPGRSLHKPAMHHSQDSIIVPVNNPISASPAPQNRSLDELHRYSIESLDSADFLPPSDSYRMYTSSPRQDRKGTDEPTDLNALLRNMLAQGVTEYDYRPSTDPKPLDLTSGPVRPVSEILRPTEGIPFHVNDDLLDDESPSSTDPVQPRTRLTSDSVLAFSNRNGPTTVKRRGIRVLKMGRPRQSKGDDQPLPTATPDVPSNNRIEPEVGDRSEKNMVLGAQPNEEAAASAFIQLSTVPSATSPSSASEQPSVIEEPQIERDIATQLAQKQEEIPQDPCLKKSPDQELPNALETGREKSTEESAPRDLDDTIDELAAQYELEDEEDAQIEPQTEHVREKVVLPPRVSFNANLYRDVNRAFRAAKRKQVTMSAYRRSEESHTHMYSLTSRSPSPAKSVLRKLPPSPIVTRVRSSPVTTRRSNMSVPVGTLPSRTVAAPPPPPPPPPAHPGLSRRGVQVLWVARRYRVLKLLEDAYPNSVTADELLRYYKIYAGRSTRLVDVASLTSILQWLSHRGLVKEVEAGQWMRLETVRSSVTKIVTELPLLPPHEMPSVALVTLMYNEKLAVDAMIENKNTYVWRRPHDRGEGQVVTFGNIGHVRVISTKLPKPGEGESAMMVARQATSRVIGSFTSVTRVILVGVAGGIAHFTDDRRHIRRGDVVVCKPKQARAPMYIYCTGTERSYGGDYRFASRNWVTKDEALENLINSFQIRQRKDPNFCPWERYIREGLNILSGGDVDFRRPPSTTDRLVRVGADGRVQEVPHPTIISKSMRDVRPGQPVVHYDVIGGGSALLGDYNKRRTFAMLTGAKAIDPGYQPVLEAIEEAQKDSVAIIRGIADYSDGRSDSYWQPYACLAAASFAKSLLLELPIER